MMTLSDPSETFIEVERVVVAQSNLSLLFHAAVCIQKNEEREKASSILSRLPGREKQRSAFMPPKSQMSSPCLLAGMDKGFLNAQGQRSAANALAAKRFQLVSLGSTPNLFPINSLLSNPIGLSLATSLASPIPSMGNFSLGSMPNFGISSVPSLTCNTALVRAITITNPALQVPLTPRQSSRNLAIAIEHETRNPCVCGVPFCGVFQLIWQHLKSCSGNQCTFYLCPASRMITAHARACESEEKFCSVCTPFNASFTAERPSHPQDIIALHAGLGPRRLPADLLAYLFDDMNSIIYEYFERVTFKNI